MALRAALLALLIAGCLADVSVNVDVNVADEEGEGDVEIVTIPVPVNVTVISDIIPPCPYEGYGRCQNEPFQCIPESWFCDNYCDCDNCTDELDCLYPCYWWENACGGDPAEGCKYEWYTESNCTQFAFACENEAGQCVDPSFTCDGFCDCADNCADECSPGSCMSPPDPICRPGYSNCEDDPYNYQCKPYYYGWAGADSTSNFTCSSGKQIYTSWVCDGWCDCIDFCEDECLANCPLRDDKEIVEKDPELAKTFEDKIAENLAELEAEKEVVQQERNKNKN